MPNLPDLATQVGLVVFAQALAFAVTPSTGPGEDTVGPEATTIVVPAASHDDAPFTFQVPVEVAGTPVAGKRTDRLVPGSSPMSVAPVLVAQAGERGLRPARERRGPPREAIRACTPLKAGAACSFANREGRGVEGTCRPGPRGEALACVPTGERPGRGSKRIRD